MTSVLLPGRHDRGVIDPGPVIASGGVADLDIEIQRLRGGGVKVRLEEVVAAPVLRLIQADVRPIEPQRLAPLAGMHADHGAPGQRIPILERGDRLDRRALELILALADLE